MTKIPTSIFALTALPWALTTLFKADWWQSPAFTNTGLPLWVSGILWSISAAVMLVLLAGKALKPSVVNLGLVCYALPTTLMGISIVWFTIESNAVSAMGSAIAWLALGLGAFWRAALVSNVAAASVDMEA